MSRGIGPLAINHNNYNHFVYVRAQSKHPLDALGAGFSQGKIFPGTYMDFRRRRNREGVN